MVAPQRESLALAFDGLRTVQLAHQRAVLLSRSFCTNSSFIS